MLFQSPVPLERMARHVNGEALQESPMLIVDRTVAVNSFANANKSECKNKQNEATRE
jgi:hypothetical protein